MGSQFVAPSASNSKSADVFTLLRLPARLDVQQTAKLLGFADHDIPVLVRVKLLRPLGNPAPNAPKFYAAVEIQAIAADREWLSRATNAIMRHWQSKNQKKVDRIEV